jgi:hypothetical protein
MSPGVHKAGIGGSDGGAPPSQFANSPLAQSPCPQVSVLPSAARHAPQVANSPPAQVWVPLPQQACVAPGVLHDVATSLPLPLPPAEGPFPAPDVPEPFGKQPAASAPTISNRYDLQLHMTALRMRCTAERVPLVGGRNLPAESGMSWGAGASHVLAPCLVQCGPVADLQIPQASGTGRAR